MTPDAPFHQFRKPAAPRNRLRASCRPAMSPFRDWLRPGKCWEAAPVMRPEPDAPAPGPRSERDILFTPLAPNAIRGETRREQRTPIDWSQLVPSPIEWVYMNKLGRKFPEAWEYMRREALLYGGDDPDAYSYGNPSGTEPQQ